MIIKLDLSGEKYSALLGALMDDANHYTCIRDLSGAPCTEERAPFVKIMHAEGHGETADSMCPHSVELRVLERYSPKGSSREIKVPSCVLANIFIAVGRYPMVAE